LARLMIASAEIPTMARPAQIVAKNKDSNYALRQ
jgi:hypothetical protein